MSDCLKTVPKMAGKGKRQITITMKKEEERAATSNTCIGTADSLAHSPNYGKTGSFDPGFDPGFIPSQALTDEVSPSVEDATNTQCGEHAVVAFTSSAVKPTRQVTLKTFTRWLSQYEQDHQTSTWLRCDPDSDNKALVSCLWCELCRKFEHSVSGTRSFSRAWVVGSNNQRASNIIDHALSEQHRLAANKFREEQARSSNQPITTYAPVAKGLLAIGKRELEKLGKKFDLCYVLAKENLAFRKYPALVSLEKRHGVDVGTAYLNKASARVFTHSIAESQ